MRRDERRAGCGLVDLLLGRVSPSGRLTMSVPDDVGELPAYYNRCRTGRPKSGGYRDKGRYLVRIAPHAAAGEPEVFERRGVSR